MEVYNGIVERHYGPSKWIPVFARLAWSPPTLFGPDPLKDRINVFTDVGKGGVAVIVYQDKHPRHIFRILFLGPHGLQPTLEIEHRLQCEHMTRRKFILASVLALQNSSFLYPSCQKCLSRIIVVSRSLLVQKCGSTDEIENVRFRYRLSLKVAESNRLFDITVFGSCLDRFFGLTATDLHSYLQEPGRTQKTLDWTATQNLLTKAVQTSFVGQSFIFGVTNFEKQCGPGSDSSNSRKPFSDQHKEIKALVACQILLPDPSLAGFTVIDYFNQLLQLSDFGKHHCDSCASNSYLLALEHSNSDPSNLDGSDKSSCLFGYHSSKVFSRSWQLSLELVSINSQLTDDDNDFQVLESSWAIGTHHKHKKCPSFAKATNSDGYSSAIQGSWSLISYMDKKGLTQKLNETLDLQALQPSTVQSSHGIGITNSQLLPLNIQGSLETRNTKSTHSTIETKIKYSLFNKQYHQHQDIDTHLNFQGRSVYNLPSSLKQEEISHGSQNYDNEIWDELPFSESLNKFLAATENEIALSKPNASSGNFDLDNDINKLHAHFKKFSVTPQRTTRTLHTLPVDLRLSQAKANSSKNNNLSYCEANPSSSIRIDSPPNNTAATVSKSRDISDFFLPNAYLSTIFSSSKGLGKTGISKCIKIPPHRTGISHINSTSENDHAYLDIQYFNGQEEKSLLEMSKKLKTLRSKRYSDKSDLCDLKNKQYFTWLKDRSDFTICRKLTYPLEDLCSTDRLKEIPCEQIGNNLTQNCHESSYDASADLFEDNTKEIDIATEITQNSQDILLQWEKSLTDSHMESEFSLKPLSGNFSQSSLKSSQNKSVSLYSRTYFSPPYFHSESDCDFEDSQDFVPCSQSTPLAGFHQTRIHGMKKTTKMLPDFYMGCDTNYRKTSISPENYIQHTPPCCSKSILSPKQKSKGSLIQPEIFNNNSTTGCLAIDLSEYIPPSTQKAFSSEMFGCQTLGKRCFTPLNSDQKELPKKKVKYDRQRAEKGLIKKKLSLKTVTKIKVTKQKTSNMISGGKISRESIWGHDSCLEVNYCLPYSDKRLFSVPEMNSAWSPELF
ncbi:LOW QUALITY PROTEIN: DNA damage-induced apoptosis suppressor protein [Suncus etruscus]|uniref:LOW QUALITY PROTEIN: DNA damage-induced apoptosis suppressor protein n=1 Tax=Suncus etruscus TaxID=109475 RepID=UPI00211055AC|nr:LOW QUALITY PROTEIN: DNA damage-induced apoptosis suppressor protein [Suncus etruscus]